jgi:hypothetical protein
MKQLLFTTTVKVNTIETDNKTLLSGKEALNLFEAAKVATERGPVNSFWDDDLVRKVIDILQTHPVRIGARLAQWATCQ